MWYFSWILGVGLACSFGILNAMWYEFKDQQAVADGHKESDADLH